MQRNIQALGEREFDLLVVGGGAAGAAAAREAGLRGLSTALIERDDFGGGTSAHCFKVVHGGIRYLQHADVRRLRASCRERAVFLRIAPHLVAPMAFAIPTYGHGRSSRWLLRAGMSVYDLLSADCNQLVLDRSRRISRTRALTRAETLERFPSVPRERLTGAAVFEDGQMYNPPRLVLAFAAAAHALGAHIANYVEALELLREGERVCGVAARDRLSGERFAIRARVVLNAAGPWAEALLPSRQAMPGTYSRDACFVIERAADAGMALAVQGATRDSDAVLARQARHLFLVPWRGRTLVGVWHRVVARDPDRVELTRAELREYIAEINRAHPALALREAEVRMAGFGLVPFGAASRQRPGALSFGKSSRITDHRAHGLAGLVSMISVRFTVARMDAVAALDLACAQLGQRAAQPVQATAQSAQAAAASGSDVRPLPGGEIEDFERFARELRARNGLAVPPATADALARNYGTQAARVLALAQADPTLRRCVVGTHVLRAEVVHAMRAEMAQRLGDVLFRRTDLASAGHPGTEAIEETLELMRRELAWPARRVSEERAAVQDHLTRYLAPAPAAGLSARSA